jgi:ribosomal protein S18 acetylase RimI-like enzyme
MGGATPMAVDRPENRPRIRDLRMEDLAHVVRIDAAHTGVAKPDYWSGVFDCFVATAQRPSGVGLGAEIAGQLVGYLLGEVRAFEFGSEPCGWIFAVGVDPDHQRLGIASELVRSASRRFHDSGVDRVRTMVQRDDIPLMAFFRSNGFVGGTFYQLEMDLEEAR